MEKQYTLLGTSDCETCWCCGKTGLKSTVALRNIESDDVVYFGSVCAAKALNYTIGGQNIKGRGKTYIETSFYLELQKRVLLIHWEAGDFKFSSGRPMKWQSNFDLSPLTEQEQNEFTAYVSKLKMLCQKYEILPELVFWNGRYYNGVLSVQGFGKKHFESLKITTA